MSYLHQHRSPVGGKSSAAKSDKDLMQDVLVILLREEDNKYCADCEAKSPRWASWNIGVFVCIRCAGIHRKLGVHISRVKSVNLDSWTVDQVAGVAAVGNTLARAAYEANLPHGFRRPNSDAGMEQFIKAKYEERRYLIADFKAPRPDPSAVYSLLKSPAVAAQQQQHQAPQQQQQRLVLPRPPATAAAMAAPAATATAEGQTPAAKPQQPPPPPDLLLIGDEVSGNGSAAAASPDSDFGSFAAAATSGQQQPRLVNPDLIFDDGLGWPAASAEAAAPPAPAKSAKDSIMALYGPGQHPQSQHQVLGVGGMHYSASSPMLTMGQHPLYQLQQQPQLLQQQPGLYSHAAGTLIYSAGLQQQQQQQPHQLQYPATGFPYPVQQQQQPQQQMQYPATGFPYPVQQPQQHQQLQQQQQQQPVAGSQSAYLQQIQSQMASMGFTGASRIQQQPPRTQGSNDLPADIWN